MRSDKIVESPCEHKTGLSTGLLPKSRIAADGLIDPRHIIMSDGIRAIDPLGHDIQIDVHFLGHERLNHDQVVPCKSVMPLHALKCFGTVTFVRSKIISNYDCVRVRLANLRN